MIHLSNYNVVDLQSCKGQSETSLTFKVPHGDFWAFKHQGILWTKIGRSCEMNAYELTTDELSSFCENTRQSRTV